MTPAPPAGLAALALAASAFLLAVAPAGAAPTWLSPAPLSATGHNAEAIQVAVDAEGDALSVWQNSATKVIEAAGRPAGGTWQAPAVISNPADEALLPQVALDSHGDAVVVWEGYVGLEYTIEATTRTGLGGAWQAPSPLAKLGMTLEQRPGLAVDPQGDAVAIWQRTVIGEGTVEAASRPAGGSWQAPATLSSSSEPMHPAEVALDAHGDATAVWEERGPVHIDAATKHAGGEWQPKVTLSEPNSNEPRVAVDGAGDAVAVWEHFSEEEHIEAATRLAASAIWGSPVALTQSEPSKGEPGNQEAAIDSQGNVVVVWGRLHGAVPPLHETIEASVGRVSSSSWQPPVALSGPGGPTEEAPQVAVNGQGSAVVVWERSNGGNYTVEASSGLAASGSWQPAVPLSPAGQEALGPQVALDAQGNAAAVWRGLDGKGSYIAQAAGLDAAGPLLGSLAIPASATVSQPLTFSVSPLDVWSALGATSWSFGDATGQAGTSVTHAYAAPGTYTVTVTSSDILGNTTSASAPVSIAAVPIGKPPPSLAPRITAARLTRSRFRVARGATAISAGVAQGTSFRFTLSAQAALRILFTRSAAGLRRRGRCVAPSPALRRLHARGCTRTLTVGALTRASERAGADGVAFSGRIGSRPLSPGPYTATLTASADGQRSGPVGLSLSVVR